MTRILTAAGLLLLLTIACKSLGTEQDQTEAGTLWERMSGYQTWAHFEGHEGYNKGASPHGKYVRVFLNDVGAADPVNTPHGTIIVKENLSKADPNTLQSLTVMQRIDGYDAENEDWFWARYTPAGELTHSGQVASCTDCHFDAGNDDYVFLND